MTLVGHVESLWRYPVKSMRGEELQEAFAGFGGVYGDRMYAIHNPTAHAGFPYLTGREQQRMLLYRPVYQDAAQMRLPPNLAEAVALGPGITPVYPDQASVKVNVHTPDGEDLAIDDPRLMALLSEGLRDRPELSLMRSDRALTDCRPISLFSLQTRRKLSEETDADLDKLRFRANVFFDSLSQVPFEEDQFVGRMLRIGEKAMIAVVDRDPRCKMITLDPHTGEANPEVMRSLSRKHEGKAGVYAAVVVEGTIRTGDPIMLLNVA